MHSPCHNRLKTFFCIQWRIDSPMKMSVAIIDTHKITDCNICIFLFCQCNHLRNHILVNVVIAVYILNIFSSRSLQTCQPCASQAEILFVVNNLSLSHSIWVFRKHLSQYVNTIIRSTIIYKYYLQIFICQLKYRTRTSLYVFLNIINRD